MIAIIDYGAGNTKSVMNALDRLQARYKLTNDISELQAADKIILPGVGNAKPAMDALDKCGLSNIISTLQQPLLGICLGMQLLFEYTEEGDTKCLNIVPGSIRKFANTTNPVPAMGWNTVKHNGSGIFKNIANDSHFYFVHSYYAQVQELIIATTTYDIRYGVAVHYKNFYGVQFHPEKSGAAGSQLLANFINLKS